MPFTSRTRTLYAAIGLGVVSFALSPILIRWAEATGAPSGLAIAAWRTALASLLLAPVALPRIRRDWRALPARDAWWTAAAGILLGLHFVAWIESLYHTSVASSTVLVTTGPVIMAALGFVLLGERLRRGVVGAIVLAVAGAALIAYGDAVAGHGKTASGGKLFGNALAFGAAILASGYLLVGRVVRQRAGWLAYVFPLYTVSAVTTVGVAIWQGVPLFGYEWSFYGLCLAMAVGPQLVGHGAFNYALQSVPAALVGMLALLEPVGASLLAYAFFGEAPTLLAVGGMTTVLVATGAVVLLRRRGESRTPERESKPTGAAGG